MKQKAALTTIITQQLRIKLRKMQIKPRRTSKTKVWWDHREKSSCVYILRCFLEAFELKHERDPHRHSPERESAERTEHWHESGEITRHERSRNTSSSDTNPLQEATLWTSGGNRAPQQRSTPDAAPARLPRQLAINTTRFIYLNDMGVNEEVCSVSLCCTYSSLSRGGARDTQINK